MKVTDIRLTEPVYEKLARYWSNAIQEGPKGSLLTFRALQIFTDEGITGVGPWRGGAVAHLESLRPFVVGEDPMDVERIWHKMYWSHFSDGRSGVIVRAMGAIDVALWDVIGKALKKPVYKLLGGFKSRVPCYASGGGIGFYGKDEPKEMQNYVEEGFKAVKMKIGMQNFQDDLARVKAIRDAVGLDVDILLDVNNGWSVNTAIRCAKKLERYEPGWLEEPVLTDDIPGMARLVAATEIPIATGESENSLLVFKAYMENKCCDVIQADPIHCGITQWKKIAAMAEAHKLHMAPHFSNPHRVDAHCVAGVPNGLRIEHWYMSEAEPKFDFWKPALEPKQGWVDLPQTPGFGIELDFEAMQRYREENKIDPRAQPVQTTNGPKMARLYLRSALPP